MDEEQLEAARAVALHFVEYAPRSRAEVVRRLQRGHFEPEIIEAVTADFEQRGILDDPVFARAWVEDRGARKRYGRARLAQELQRKGLSREDASAALEGLDPDVERDSALEAARLWLLRHASEGDPLAEGDSLAEVDALAEGDSFAQKRKLTAFLQRRGFSLSMIMQVFSDLMVN